MLNINTAQTSEHTIQCFVDKLSSQSKIENDLFHETKTLLMNLAEIFYHQKSIDENVIFRRLFENILAFSLSEKPLQYSFNDCDGNSYTLNKTGSKVSLLKQVPLKRHFSISSGLITTPEKTVSLYDFEATLLQAGLENIMVSFTPNAIDDMFTLLCKNPGAILPLANRIVEDKDQLFPATLVNLAKCYIWKMNHNGSLPKLVPTFPVNAILERGETKSYSPALMAFLEDGLLPTDEEKSQLAVEFVLAAKCHWSKIDHYLIAIFNDVQHANFISCFRNLRLEGTHNREYTTFINLTSFLQLHFKGRALSVNLKEFDFLQTGPAITAICQLINHNPHIKTLHIENMQALENEQKQLFQAVGKSKSLTTLSLPLCNLLKVDDLIEAINNNPALTKINLESNFLNFNDAKELMRTKQLTWLNLEKNFLFVKEFAQLYNVLKHNFSLTYCNVGQKTETGMPPEFDAHLLENAKNAKFALWNRLHLLSYAEVAQALPTDILHLIFEIGVAGIRREVN